MKKKRDQNQQLLQKDKFQDQNVITIKGKIQKQEKLTSDDQTIISQMIYSNLQQQQNELDLFQFFNDSIWTLQFECMFYDDMKHQQKQLLYHLCHITQEYFIKQQENWTKSVILPLMKIYQGLFYSYHNGLYIIFECGLRKTIKEENKVQVSINVQFTHKMTFIDILETEKNLEKTIIELLQNYQQSQVNLIDQTTIQYLKEVSLTEIVNKNTRTPNIVQLFKKNAEQNWTVLQFQASKEKAQWYPNYFDCIKIDKPEKQNNLLKDEQSIKN